MAKTKKVFSKDKWLQSANEQKARGELSQREIDDALDIWVNDLDGKTKEEIESVQGAGAMRDDWYVEVVI